MCIRDSSRIKDFESAHSQGRAGGRSQGRAGSGRCQWGDAVAHCGRAPWPAFSGDGGPSGV
eukprot:9977283-Alexandrium_andersonii.AAC.1